MKLSKKLKAARKKANLTQSELADKLNVSRKTISSWENDRNVPDSDSLKQISITLNVDIKKLLDIKSESTVPNNSIKKPTFKLFLFVSNALLLIANVLISLFIPYKIPGITLLQILITLLMLHYFKKIGKKLQIPYQVASLLISAVAFFLISINQLISLTLEITFGSVIGLLIKTATLTVSFYLILVYFHNNKWSFKNGTLSFPMLYKSLQNK